MVDSAFHGWSSRVSLMAPANDSWGENGGVREVTTHSAPRSCVARATAGLDALEIGARHT